jgi:CBS domain-containing protein
MTTIASSLSLDAIEAREVMSTGLVSCPPCATLADVATLMAVHQVHAVVVDPGAPRLITARDVIWATLAGATSADEARHNGAEIRQIALGVGEVAGHGKRLQMVGVALVVGLEPHVLGAHNPGMVKDPFTADETIALFRRFDAEENSRSQSVYGACGLPGAPYRPWRRPHPRR